MDFVFSAPSARRFLRPGLLARWTVWVGLLLCTLTSRGAESRPSGPIFSQTHGFKRTSFNLSLSAPSKGGSIRYTLDGSEPSESEGTLYRAPIPIRKTSVVRALWINPEGASSLIETRSYLFVEDIIKQAPAGTTPSGWPASWGANRVDYGMDPRVTQSAAFKSLIRPALTSIPSLSIVLPLESLFDPGTGIYANAGYRGVEWERHASIELITPAGGDGFCARGGLKIRGGYSRVGDNPKHSFRFYFREKYGQPELQYPLFGATGAASFDKFDLRCDQVNSWHWMGNANNDFIRDQWARNTMLAMGQPADRGHFYHLYLNGMYWGLYNTQEKHDAAFGASYFGGDEEDYDVVKYDNNSGGTTDTDGTFGSWRRLRDLGAAGLTTPEAYQRIQGNNPDGRRNPAYDRLLDVDNLIDYMLLGIYFATHDNPPDRGCQNNWAAFRSRKNDFGYRFFPHDWELGFNEHTESILDPLPNPDYIQSTQANGCNPWHLWEALRPNPEFRLRVADRVQKHFLNGGVLSPFKAAGSYRELMEQIQLAVVAESARWGDSAFKNGGGGGGWWGGGQPIQPGLLTQADWLKITNDYYLSTFFPQRTAIVLGQLRAASLFPELQAPLLSPRSGQFLPGQKVTLLHPDSAAQIYYTLDGSDPRLPGGALSPEALLYSAAFLPPSAAHLMARARNGSEWSPRVEANFKSTRDVSGLRFTEVHYHSKPMGTVSEDEAEFLEIKNVSQKTISLGGLRFTAGIGFEFPPGTSLAPGKFLLLGRNSEQFRAAYPGKSLSGQYDGRLSNSGEELVLSDSDGTPLLSLDYATSAPWPVAPDGLGFSLVFSGNGNPQKAKNWRPSSLPGGSPGADDPAPPLFPRVAIAAADPRPFSASDSVTIKNLGSQTADISGWWLSNDPANPVGIRIPSDSILVAGAELTVPIPLADGGGKVLLCSANTAGALTGFAHLFAYGPCAPGDLWQRFVTSNGDERFSGPNPTGVRINEIHYHPAPESQIEFVELLNTSDAPADLSLHSLDGLPFTFPEGTSLPPGTLLVVSSVPPEEFRTAFSLPPEAMVFGPATGLLSNSNHRIRLLQPVTVGQETLQRVLESVRYEDSAPWPYAADGFGYSLQRTASPQQALDPIAWSAAAPSPCALNSINAHPQISFLSPASNAEYLPGQSVTLQVQASDSDGSIREVRFFANAELIGTRETAPYSIDWVATGAKLIDFHADAEDDSGNVSSTPIRTLELGSIPQSGTGLRAEYFPNPDFTGAPVTRKESGLNYDWADIDPVPGQVSREGFSVRWSGSFLPAQSGYSRFKIYVSGKLKVWLDGNLVLEIENFQEGAEAGFNSTAGVPLALSIEYSTGSAPANLPRPPFFIAEYTPPNGGGGGGFGDGGGIIGDPIIGGGGLIIDGGGGAWRPVPEAALYLPGVDPLSFAFQTPERLANASRSKPYSLPFDTCRGSDPIRFQSTALPQGLVLSENGVLSGSPASAGVFEFTVSAADSTGASASRTFTLRVLPVNTPALPVIRLSSPAPAVTLSESPVLLQGTASSTLGVASVEYRLNDGPWRSMALSAASSPQFSVALDTVRNLQMGTNTLRLRATDTAQRYASLIERTFTYSPTAFLTLATEGSGSVSKGFAGRTRRVLGRSYSFSATPGRDHLFGGWRNEWGEVFSMERSLLFQLDSEQTLTAVFIPSPFLNSAGSYLGAVTSEEALPQGRGDLAIQINRMGSFTGRVRVGALSFPLRGAFNSSGVFQQGLGSGSARVELSLLFSSDDSSLTASLVTEVEDLSIASSSILSLPATGNPPSNRRNWDLSISGSDSPNTPTAPGSASLTLSSGQRVRIAGRLGDGTAWSLASQLLQSSQIPGFTPLYNNKGQLSGSLPIPPDAGTSTASFLWHCPPQSLPAFPAGFLLQPDVSATLR